MSVSYLLFSIFYVLLDAVIFFVPRSTFAVSQEPLFTSPADKEAFALWQEAQLLSEKGETDAAVVLFRRMTKVSPELAHYYGL